MHSACWGTAGIAPSVVTACHPHRLASQKRLIRPAVKRLHCALPKKVCRPCCVGGQEVGKPQEERSVSNKHARGASWFQRSEYDEKIVAVALPSLGALAVDPLASLVDTAFVGRIGAVALAALGPNTSVFHFTFDVFKFFTGATTTLVAQASAQGDREEAGRVVLQSLVLATILGTIAGFTLNRCAGPVLQLMGAGPLHAPLATAAAAYLHPRALAAPVVPMSMVAVGAFRGIGDSVTPFVIAMVATFTNVVLDPLLMFTLGWGIGGAAWATAIAEYTEVVLFLFLLWRGREQFGLIDAVVGAKKSLFDLSALLPVLKSTATLFLRSVVLLGFWAATTAQATRLGTAPAAAHQIALEVLMLFSLMLDALAVSGQVISARLLSTRDFATVRAVTHRLLQIAIVSASAFAMLTVATAPHFPRLFTSDARVIAETSRVLPLIGFMQPVVACTFIYEALSIAAADFWFLTCAVGGAVAVGAILLLRLGGSVVGVWTALCGMFLFRLAAASVRCYSKGGPLYTPSRQFAA
eukprot:jgi/Chlat1/3391/Chrsp23S03733